MTTFKGLLEGCYEYIDGSKYIGEWNKCAEKHGHGEYIFPEGSRYMGRFEKNLPSGLGAMLFADGDIYIGEFMQGWFHGKGVYQLSNGTRFEGEFRGGMIWGRGLTTFSDGSHGSPQYEGFFKNWVFLRNENCDEIVDIVRNNALNLGFLFEGNPPIYRLDESLLVVS